MEEDPLKKASTETYHNSKRDGWNGHKCNSEKRALVSGVNARSELKENTKEA